MHVRIVLFLITKFAAHERKKKRRRKKRLRKLIYDRPMSADRSTAPAYDIRSFGMGAAQNPSLFSLFFFFWLRHMSDSEVFSVAVAFRRLSIIYIPAGDNGYDDSGNGSVSGGIKKHHDYSNRYGVAWRIGHSRF